MLKKEQNHIEMRRTRKKTGIKKNSKGYACRKKEHIDTDTLL